MNSSLAFHRLHFQKDRPEEDRHYRLNPPRQEHQDLENIEETTSTNTDSERLVFRPVPPLFGSLQEAPKQAGCNYWPRLEAPR